MIPSRSTLRNLAHDVSMPDRGLADTAVDFGCSRSRPSPQSTSRQTTHRVTDDGHAGVPFTDSYPNSYPDSCAAVSVSRDQVMVWIPSLFIEGSAETNLTRGSAPRSSCTRDMAVLGLRRRERRLSDAGRNIIRPVNAGTQCRSAGQTIERDRAACSTASTRHFRRREAPSGEAV
jgi:hypothetical protein